MRSRGIAAAGPKPAAPNCCPNRERRGNNERMIKFCLEYSEPFFLFKLSGKNGNFDAYLNEGIAFERITELYVIHVGPFFCKHLKERSNVFRLLWDIYRDDMTNTI